MEYEQSTFKENSTSSIFNVTSNSTGSAAVFQDEPVAAGIAQSVIGVIGIFGNLCVIITFSTNKKLRNKRLNMYIINQASTSVYH